jgi:hypothetical protein
MKINEIKDDLLTLIMSNACNRDLEPQERAKRIRKCAKLICNRTQDKVLKTSCRAIRATKSDDLVVNAVERAEYRYFFEKI